MGGLKINEVCCISLIRGSKSTKQPQQKQITHVNWQTKYLKYVCPTKFRAGYTYTIQISLITEHANCHFQKFLYVEISSVNSNILSLA